jgi:hypothetical protein
VLNHLNQSLSAEEQCGADFSLPKIRSNYKGDTVAPLVFGPSQQRKTPRDSVTSLAAGGPSMTSRPSVSAAPAREVGWLKKEGRGMIKSVTNRYFVLDEGVLRYYEKSSAQPPYGIGEKGQVSIRGAAVEKKDKFKIYLISSGGGERNLMLQCPDGAECTRWTTALSSHIAFYK